MRIKYVGDHEEFTAYDITFPKGKAVEVPDDAIAYKTRKRLSIYDREQTVVTAKVIDKLAGNPDFEIVKVGRPSNDKG